MICVRYRGGLGNQMYQFAFQKLLENNGNNVYADLSSFVQFPEHNGYELEKVFNIQLKIATKEVLCSISPYYIDYPKVYNLLPSDIKDKKKKLYQDRIRKERLKISDVNNAYYLQENHCSYDKCVMNLSETRDYYLDGLWQNVRYFEGISEEIRNSFCFSNRIAALNSKMEEYRSLLEGNKSVALHVRRGDFANSKFDICSEKYYRLAVERLGILIDNTDFCFFTDDENYIRDSFKWVTRKHIICSGSINAATDMYLMTFSRRIIISNSSFSFWGAYLNRFDDVSVIAPEFSLIKGNRSYPLYVPDNWVSIKV